MHTDGLSTWDFAIFWPWDQKIAPRNLTIKSSPLEILKINGA